MPRPFRSALILGASALSVALYATPQADKPIALNLKMEPGALNEAGMTKYRTGYYPIALTLQTSKPDAIKKEPAYKGTPKYATFRLGNGAKAEYLLALDETPDACRIYLDANRNGDLTDDGDGAWSKRSENNKRVMYGVNSYVLRASWGTAERETGSGKYGVGFYYFANQPRLMMKREAARTGTIQLGDKTYPMMLAENDADALYSKPVETDEKGAPLKSPQTRPVWLMIDKNSDGKFAGTGEAQEIFDIRAPFALDGKTYEATVKEDGSRLTLKTTTRVAADFTPKRPPLLAAGTVAPDFSAPKYGGGTLKLSDYRGKIVILDFWATWCGPCQKSMPHVEKVYQAVKEKGVEVIALCVWDEQAEYDQWVPTNKSKYTFTFAFDPAGRNAAQSVAGKLYQVSGIPTTYIIDKEGKVVEAVVGYTGDDDRRIEKALEKVGVIVPVQTAQK